jgi:hypothetical protein
MGFGMSILPIAVGAILRFAVSVTTQRSTFTRSA